MTAHTDVPAELQLDIDGMTCASCAARIENTLNRLDGVTATVNYATENARVRLPVGGPDIDAVIAAVAATGYRASVPAPPQERAADDGEHAEHDHGDLRDLRQRLLISALLAAPVVLLAMVPALQFDSWQWLSLTLAAPVVVWGGVAVPPGGVDEPAPWCSDDGHAHLDGHPRRVRVVAVRAVPR